MIRNQYGNKGQARILVVDDDLTLALALSEFLVEQGYGVATAFSGQEAIEKAADFSPNLLISDVCMDGVNGVEAAVAITAMLPGCRVLFLSGIASMYDLMSAAPEGLVYSFIPKPLHPLDLLNAIAYMLPATPTPHEQASIIHERNANPHTTKFIFSEAGA